MLMHDLVKRDDVIYWEKVAVDDEGNAVFAEPIIIKARWDTVSESSQMDDLVKTESRSNTVYPDRVLAIGSYLLLGNEDDRDDLPYEQRRDPRLIRNAREVSSQSTVFELGWEQHNVKPGFRSPHVTIEVQVG